MLSSIRNLAACALVLTAAAADPASSQATDTSRAARPPMREGMPGDVMRERMRARMRADDAVGSRRGDVRRDRGFRGRRGAPGRGIGMRGPNGPGALMRGITLSVDQEKALRTNQARHLMATKPLMLEMMSARTDEQLARLNGDQKALDAASARLSTSRAKLDSLRGNRSPATELRAVLTPEQQVILDRNLAAPGFRGNARRGAFGPPGMRERMRDDAPDGLRDGATPGPRRGMLPPTRSRPGNLDESYDRDVER